MKKIILVLIISILSATQLCASVFVGYTTENIPTDKFFRLGSGTDQRLAVRFGTDKLALLKGKKVTGIRMAFGSKNSTDNKATLFLSESLDAEPSITQEITIDSEKEMTEFTLDTPYVITGDEADLFVGCMMQISSKYGPFSADGTSDSKGIAYAYNATGWQDLYGKGYGMPNIELIVDDADFTDLTIKSHEDDSFMKENKPVSGSFEVFNFGTKEINNFEAVVSLGRVEKIVNVTENILPKQTCRFNVDIIPTNVGASEYNVSLRNINGGEDDDIFDNSITSDVYVYKTDCQKNVLVEGFTGQTCSSCPAGHVSMNNAIAETSVPVVEIYHHSGYVTDYFTMTEDWDVADCFNVMYAPAAMVNRSLIGSNTTPVFDPWSKSNCVKALNQTNGVKPYVEINLQSDFNSDTREVVLNAKINTLEAMPGNDIRYSIWLVQDSIVSKQTGADDSYIHMAVSRGCLTDVNGEGASFVPGETLEIEKTFVLQDTIASTSYTKNDDKNKIAVVPKNMKIVLFVHQFDKNSSQYQVFNCEEVALTDEETNGISDIKANSDQNNVRKYIKDGRLVILKNNQTFRIDGIKLQ